MFPLSTIRGLLSYDVKIVSWIWNGNYVIVHCLGFIHLSNTSKQYPIQIKIR